jgi:hypothetical protein
MWCPLLNPPSLTPPNRNTTSLRQNTDNMGVNVNVNNNLPSCSEVHMQLKPHISTTCIHHLRENSVLPTGYVKKSRREGNLAERSKAPRQGDILNHIILIILVLKSSVV